MVVQNHSKSSKLAPGKSLHAINNSLLL